MMGKIEDLYNRNLEEYESLRNRIKQVKDRIKPTEQDNEPQKIEKPVNLIDQGSRICERYHIIMDSLNNPKYKHSAIQSLKLLTQEIDVLISQIDSKLANLNSSSK